LTWSPRAAPSPCSGVAFSFGVNVPEPPPGRWPEFSWASTVALSPASWAVASLDLNVPAAALGLADAAASWVGEPVLAAAAASGPASVAPITPPAISDPATPAIVITRCVGVMLLTSFSSEMQAWRNGRLHTGLSLPRRTFQKDYSEGGLAPRAAAFRVTTRPAIRCAPAARLLGGG